MAPVIARARKKLLINHSFFLSLSAFTSSFFHYFSIDWASSTYTMYRMFCSSAQKSEPCACVCPFLHRSVSRFIAFALSLSFYLSSCLRVAILFCSRSAKIAQESTAVETNAEMHPEWITKTIAVVKAF